MGLPLWIDPSEKVDVKSSRTEFTRPRANAMSSEPRPRIHEINGDPQQTFPPQQPPQQDYGRREANLIRQLEDIFRDLLTIGDRAGKILEVTMKDSEDTYRLVLEKPPSVSSARVMMLDMMGVYRLEYARENTHLYGQQGWEIDDAWLIERLWLGAARYRNPDTTELPPSFPYPSEVPRLHRSDDGPNTRASLRVNRNANPDSGIQSGNSEATGSSENSPVLNGAGYDAEWTV
ncbi:hypothetical protein HYALB_00007101 [Hymenoscyphus albidus]|uniref:Uncharacterized protein n=1 Tax=Hymenoscyphus albidus TaxID=595503 RepID=A0A9N9LZ69_9HELO|nr:hypothetical protein HYALB_00007101 [Hymenoscyphus albidus]